MTTRTMLFCDFDDGCWMYERGVEPPVEKWVRIDGKDLCDFHAPCPTCGHPWIEHYGEDGCRDGIVESNTDIRPGRTMPSIDGQPGKIIDYLWFGETFTVTPGCGCREERP